MRKRSRGTHRIFEQLEQEQMHGQDQAQPRVAQSTLLSTDPFYSCHCKHRARLVFMVMVVAMVSFGGMVSARKRKHTSGKGKFMVLHLYVSHSVFIVSSYIW